MKGISYALTFCMGAIVGGTSVYIYKKYKNNKIDWSEIEEPEEPEIEKEEEKEDQEEDEEEFHNPVLDETEEDKYQRLSESLYTPKTLPVEPYLINENQYYHSRTDHDKEHLFYFEEDGTLANDDVIVDDIDYTIGVKNLYYFGTDVLEDPDIMYVRNERHGTDYEVSCEHMRYEDKYPQA